MYVVNGFNFETQEMAEKAKREANGVKYIRSQTKMDDPEVVLKLYNKLLDKQYFVTPVGIAFMEELQEYLQSIPFFRNEDIRPIPGQASGEELLASLKKDVRTKAVEHRRMEQTANSIAASPKERAKAQKIVEEKRVRREAQARKDAQEAAIRTQVRSYKLRCTVASFFAVVFGCVIIGMFVIIHMSGNNINIINYENELINKYEKWERDLQQREAEIIKREEELGIGRE